MSAYIPSYSYPYPLFQPAMRVIASITNTPDSPYTTVTTTLNNQYRVGTIVRLDIPLLFGMQQLNQQVGTILTISNPTTFTISIDTRGFDPFVLPTTFPPQYQDAQVVPIGSQTDMVNATDIAIVTQNVYPL